MMRPPQTGELDTLITIFRGSATPWGDDDLKNQETEIIKRWAKIEPVGTAVYVESVQTESGITHRIYIDFTNLIREDDVAKTSDGRQFRVKRSCALGGGRQTTILEVEELGEI